MSSDIVFQLRAPWLKYYYTARIEKENSRVAIVLQHQYQKFQYSYDPETLPWNYKDDILSKWFFSHAIPNSPTQRLITEKEAEIFLEERKPFTLYGPAYEDILLLGKYRYILTPFQYKEFTARSGTVFILPVEVHKEARDRHESFADCFFEIYPNFIYCAHNRSDFNQDIMRFHLKEITIHMPTGSPREFLEAQRNIQKMAEICKLPDLGNISRTCN